MVRDYAALSPAFPKKKGKKGKKAKDTETKSSVDPHIEGYTPKGAMRGGGTTTVSKQKAREKRLAGMKL